MLVGGVGVYLKYYQLLTIGENNWIVLEFRSIGGDIDSEASQVKVIINWLSGTRLINRVGRILSLLY